MDELISGALHKVQRGEELTAEEREALAKHFARKGPTGWGTKLKKGDEVEIHGLKGVVKVAGRRNLSLTLAQQ